MEDVFDHLFAHCHKVDKPAMSTKVYTADAENNRIYVGV